MSNNGFSVLIQVDGKTVFESYKEGHTPETPHRLASGTKSFSGALLALAVKDGLLTPDEPVSDTIEEWKGDTNLSKITVRQLLSLTSGIEPGDNGKVPSYSEAIEVKSVHPPGETFSYGPVSFQVFGELITRKLEATKALSYVDPLEYLKDRVFVPTGMQYEAWRRDEDGSPHLPSGAFFTPREWAKYGELLLADGVRNDEVILDADTLKACLKGSAANRQYGLTFWLLDSEPGADVPFWKRGAYMAAGAGKQRLYIFPAVSVLVVCQGESRAFEDDEFLARLFVER